jgi:hypothetical protein
MILEEVVDTNLTLPPYEFPPMSDQRKLDILESYHIQRNKTGN